MGEIPKGGGAGGHRKDVAMGQPIYETATWNNDWKHSAGFGNQELMTKVFDSALLRATPLDKIYNFQYRRLLLEGIKSLDTEELTSLQKLVIPYILRGDDCFIIGGDDRERRISYLLPIIGHLLETVRQSVLSKGCPDQPVLLIVCNDIVSAQNVCNDIILSLLRPINQRSLSFAVFESTRDLLKLPNGTNILITTSSVMYDLLRYYGGKVDLCCLRYIVYEGCDKLIKYKREAFEFIQNAINNSVDPSNVNMFQRLFSGNKWCAEVEYLFMKQNRLDAPGKIDKNPKWSPVLLINSPNEVVRYAEIKFIFHHVARSTPGQEVEKNKLDSLAELLRSVDLFQHKAIFIVCTNPTAVNTVQQGLAKRDIIGVRYCDSTMPNYALQQLESEWRSSVGTHEKAILVIEDCQISNLKIKNVTCVINFDLPEKEESDKSARGVRRLSCMSKNFRDITAEKISKTVKHRRTELHSHYIMDGTESALYSLRNFVLKMPVNQIPDSLNQIADEMENKALENRPMCELILLFGVCNLEKCDLRHKFLMSDLLKDPVVPRSGEIKIHITHCRSPSHYTGRVVKCFNTTGRRTLRFDWTDQYEEMKHRLKAYYEEERHRIQPESFEAGTLCAVVINRNEIQRARINAVLTRFDGYRFPKQLLVFCIDSGSIVRPLANDVYQLPSFLKDVPQMGVEIILAGLVPHDSDQNYGARVNRKASEFTENKPMTAKIQFAMVDKVWVNPMCYFPQDDPTNQDESATRYSVRLELTNSRVAVLNEDHMQKLKNLLRGTGYKCPELYDENNPMIDLEFMKTFCDEWEYDWAFIPGGKEDPVMVPMWTTYVDNPFRIFGTFEKYEQQLDDLNGEINRTINSLIKGRCSEYAIHFRPWYREGMAVAVKDQFSQKWIRGLITRVEEKDGIPTFDVYFVDIGDTQNSCTTHELFPIMEKFVRRLPSQAVALKLGHICPANKLPSWNEESFQELSKFSMEENEMGRLIDVVRVDELDRTADVPCRYYSAVIFLKEGTKGNKGDELGELLVNSGVADFVTGQTETVNDVQNLLMEKEKMNAKDSSVLERVNEITLREEETINDDNGLEFEFDSSYEGETLFREMRVNINPDNNTPRF